MPPTKELDTRLIKGYGKRFYATFSENTYAIVATNTSLVYTRVTHQCLHFLGVCMICSFGRFLKLSELSTNSMARSKIIVPEACLIRFKGQLDEMDRRAQAVGGREPDSF